MYFADLTKRFDILCNKCIKMERKFNVVIEKDEDYLYYIASVPSLPGCSGASNGTRRADEKDKRGYRTMVQITKYT